MGKYSNLTVASQNILRSLVSPLRPYSLKLRLIHASHFSFRIDSLNKVDLLEQKMRTNPDSIQTYLADYGGPPDDIDCIKHYFLAKFKNLHRSKDRSLFAHFTTVRYPSSPVIASEADSSRLLFRQATDTTSIRPVLAAVMEAVLTSSLSQAGLL